jgi:alkylation response protein AidB-like acyl-CoA dehydrogenase
MDFNDSPTEAAFRAEARAFLAEHAPDKPIGSRAHSTDRKSVLGEARDWQKRLYEHGWAALMWPKEFGGRGLGFIEQIIWNEELARAGVGESMFLPGVGMCGPTIIAHGDDELKKRFLPPMLAGDVVWCQLFSEPGAGSDLASLAMKAERDGDDWVVSGQKVWSSFADFADWGFLLVRTDPKAAKQKGITYLLVDMNAPGIEIRPLRDMAGGQHFNEVFFDSVRVPDANRVGEVNGGWAVAKTTLMYERMAIGSVSRFFSYDDLAAFAREHGDRLDQTTRDALARVYTWTRSLDLLNARVNTMLSHGQDPSAEASVMKLAIARILTAAADIGMDVQALGGLGGQGDWQHQFLFSPAMHIAGGTEEIQKNVVAERVLGMPREPDPLAGAPFEDLPHS